MSRRNKVASNSLSPVNKRTLRSNSTSSDLLPGLSDKRRKRLLSSLTDNVNDGSSVSPPLLISGGDGSSSSIDIDDFEDESMDIEDPDGFDGLYLDNYVEDRSYESLYPTTFDAEYDYNEQNPRNNQYGVAYNTSNLNNQYDLRRFDDILKAKKNRSRYADDPVSTYGSVAAYRANNADTAFLRAYDNLEWSDKYQIGKEKERGVM